MTEATPEPFHDGHTAVRPFTAAELGAYAAGRPGDHAAAPPHPSSETLGPPGPPSALIRSAPEARPPSGHAGEPRRFMTATDFLERRIETAERGPATWGWQGVVRRLTGGLRPRPPAS